MVVINQSCHQQWQHAGFDDLTCTDLIHVVTSCLAGGGTRITRSTSSSSASIVHIRNYSLV
jgi:hypothetical protein